MKKSKFLKKSLATLLALMLVVAMIPMSAAAAECIARFWLYACSGRYSPTKTAGGWAAGLTLGLRLK